jgi:hypothetical protein
MTEGHGYKEKEREEKITRKEQLDIYAQRRSHASIMSVVRSAGL